MTDVEYLRPNRTVETIRLSHGDFIKTVFVFNYEGVHFRVFESITEAFKSATGNANTKLIADFNKESELDNFLKNSIKI